MNSDPQVPETSASSDEKKPESSTPLIWGTLFVVLVLGAVLYGWPKYDVWRKGLVGEAELRRAEQNRRITVEEARAKLDAAKSLAEAEVERARGVAEANKIIGASLKGNEAYLRYLWINGLQEGATPQVIYVPTEGGLPIMEAGRLSHLPPSPVPQKGPED